MSDIAHEQTNQKLRELEKKIAATYRDAKLEMSQTVVDYFSQFEARDREMREKLENGDITKDYYKQWRLNQIGRGERYEAMRDALAERYTKANEIAVAYINDDLSYIYTLNRNYAGYDIQAQLRGETDGRS